MKLIHGFMCFAYNEMHHKGWYITYNRINFRKKYKILDYEDHSYNINKEEEVTFPNMLLHLWIFKMPVFSILQKNC